MHSKVPYDTRLENSQYQKCIGISILEHSNQLYICLYFHSPNVLHQTAEDIYHNSFNSMQDIFGETLGNIYNLNLDEHDMQTSYCKLTCSLVNCSNLAESQTFNVFHCFILIF